MTTPEIGALNQFKQELRILLLGPYGDCREDLISMKEYLVLKGF